MTDVDIYVSQYFNYCGNIIKHVNIVDISAPTHLRVPYTGTDEVSACMYVQTSDFIMWWTTNITFNHVMNFAKINYCRFCDYHETDE